MAEIVGFFFFCENCHSLFTPTCTFGQNPVASCSIDCEMSVHPHAPSEGRPPSSGETCAVFIPDRWADQSCFLETNVTFYRHNFILLSPWHVSHLLFFFFFFTSPLFVLFLLSVWTDHTSGAYERGFLWPQLDESQRGLNTRDFIGLRTNGQ